MRGRPPRQSLENVGFAATVPPPPQKDPELELFFDGACPLCRREVRVIMALDRDKRIRFTDISVPEFDAGRVGMPYAVLMDRIHARLPGDGTFIEGVEVFRRIYAALGLGWLATISRVPGIAGGLELAYRTFAKNRLRLTGRCDDVVCKPGT